MPHISYFKTFRSYAKGRWIGNQLLDVLCAEFSTKTKLYFTLAIEAGAISINNKPTVPTYILKNKDTLNHFVHVHEPVFTDTIEIIHESKNLVIVNKPAGVACHPTTNYNYFTITEMLKKRFGPLGCVNRLDVPVSGVLILTSDNQAHSEMTEQKMRKIYIAKVKGKFIDINVDKQLGRVNGRQQIVKSNGKSCYTEFTLLEYKNGYSLIECRPKTGRTHQIRVHLLSIGFPIIGDKLYNEEYKVKDNPVKIDCDGKVTTSDAIEDIFNMQCDEQKKQFAIQHCEGIGNKVFINKDSFICLHAYKYILSGITYTAKPPPWAIL